MLESELNQDFFIQPGRALLILEAENQLTQTPSESSALRRDTASEEWPIIWDTRKIPDLDRKMIFIARKTNRFNSHNLVAELLNKGHLVIAEEDALRNLCNDYKINSSHWFTETKEHPYLLLCESSEIARDILLRNICSVQHTNWTTLAITGTNGKTSTTQIAGALLQELSQQPVLRIGTLGVQVGSHNWHNPFPTMPDYPGLLAALRAAKSNFNCHQLVMEATSIGLMENRLGDWPVGCGAYLNLTQDHLDYHGTMDKYFEAKSLLFKRHLSTQGQVIINCIDPYWGKALEAAKGKQRLCIGFGSPLNKELFFQLSRSFFSDQQFLEFQPLSTTTSGIRGYWTLWRDATTHLAQSQYHVRLLGSVQHENLTAAAAMMISLGYPLNQVTNSTHAISPIPGRLEPVETGTSSLNQPCVLVDYAHSPDALQKTIATCRTMIEDGGRLICVFGCGGDRDASKRPKMGRIASQLADEVWVTSDNPRTESPEKILQDILSGPKKDDAKKVKSHVDRKMAIRGAILSAHEKDIVLIAGKGHEDYQIIGTTKYPFSDLEVARLALVEKFKS